MATTAYLSSDSVRFHYLPPSMRAHEASATAIVRYAGNEFPPLAGRH